MTQLNNKIAIVTGSGGGFGEGIAKAYVHEGARVIVADINGEAATRVGLAVSATIVGMALGGWMGGVLFDLTGSYRAAFFNGLLWNLFNLAVVAMVLFRRRPAPAFT